MARNPTQTTPVADLQITYFKETREDGTNVNRVGARAPIYEDGAFTGREEQIDVALAAMVSEGHLSNADRLELIRINNVVRLGLARMASGGSLE